MWTTTRDGNIGWTEQAKMLLVGLIREHPVILAADRSENRIEKNAAWDQVYKDLIDVGLPRKAGLDRVRRCWVQYKSIALTNKKNRKKNKTLSKLDKAIVDAISNAEKLSLRHLMPQPLNIKTEPLDENEAQEIDPLETENNVTMTEETFRATEELDKTQQVRDILENQMNPVVVLHRSPIIEHAINMPISARMRPPTIDPETASRQSARYWKIMEEIAEHELQLKISQREHEEDLQRKRIILLDLQIRAETEKLGAQNSE